jgi:DNA-binding MarR family transcriptional regulator
MPTTREQSSEPDKIAQALHAVTIQLLRGLKRTDGTTSLTPARLSALSVIVHSGSISLRELALAEQVRPPTMSRIVDALEASQFVARSKDPNDGRNILLHATLKGKRLLLRGRDRRVQRLSAEIEVLEPGERVKLCATLDTLRKLAQRLHA